MNIIRAASTPHWRRYLGQFLIIVDLFAIRKSFYCILSNEEPTRSSQISSLEGLGVGMYAYKYNSGNCTGNIMNNHSFIFVDNEDLKSADDYVLWSSVGESDIMKVYGYAPRNVSGASLSSTNNIPVITYKVPSDVSSQQDIIATEAKEVKGSYRQNIPLTFRHILTGVRFKAGFDCIVNSVKVENVYSKGNFEIGGVWDNITEKTSFELSFNGGKSCSAGGYITDDAMILMMIPQLLPDDARVTLNYTENGTSGTIQASLKDLIWEKGNLITYTINKTREKDYIYFDLHAGDVIITPDSYSGYVYVNGIATEINGQIDPAKQSDNHYYIYQSTTSFALAFPHFAIRVLSSVSAHPVSDSLPQSGTHPHKSLLPGAHSIPICTIAPHILQPSPGRMSSLRKYVSRPRCP